MNRRSLLVWLVHGASLLVAGVLGVPALLTALSPALTRRSGPAWRRVGRVDEFPIGNMSQAVVDPSREGWPRSVSPQGVYVWRPAAEEFVVYSRSCTDLGCPITYDRASACFYCPCHGGIFGHDGQRMAGPPNRDLYRYATRVVEGELQVDLNSLPPMV